MTTALDLNTIRSHARESLDYGERSGDQNADTQAYDWLLALADEVEELRTYVTELEAGVQELQTCLDNAVENMGYKPSATQT